MSSWHKISPIPHVHGNGLICWSVGNLSVATPLRYFRKVKQWATISLHSLIWNRGWTFSPDFSNCLSSHTASMFSGLSAVKGSCHLHWGGIQWPCYQGRDSSGTLASWHLTSIVTGIEYTHKCIHTLTHFLWFFFSKYVIPLQMILQLHILNGLLWK